MLCHCVLHQKSAPLAAAAAAKKGVAHSTHTKKITHHALGPQLLAQKGDDLAEAAVERDLDARLLERRRAAGGAKDDDDFFCVEGVCVCGLGGARPVGSGSTYRSLLLSLFVCAQRH